MKKIELLAPAGDLEKLKIAIMYGADAVFIGGSKYSLRSRASNFTIDDIKEACSFAHMHNAKVHVTCNIIAHNENMDDLLDYLKELENAKVDAIIAADPFIINTALTKTNLEVHISTQQSSINASTVDFWESVGAYRVVLGRELSLEEIKEVKENSNLEIEVFIHGGMCVSYSGRCMLSNVMTNRDANRGGCAHSCRWNYDLFLDDKKINTDGYFAMSSKDLCSIKQIPSLIDLNIDSLKIEGRMKSIHYIATVVKTYRKLIDDYYKYKKIDDFKIYEDEIKKAENRLTSHGFFLGNVTKEQQLYNARSEMPTQEFIGIVTDYCKETNFVYLESRNFFKAPCVVEIISPNFDNKELVIDTILDIDNNVLDASRHPKQIVKFKCDFELKSYDMLRLKK